MNCDKCFESEHEGIFCRCEGRNIQVAIERRAKGESPWPSQPERLNPEARKGCDSPTSEYK